MNMYIYSCFCSHCRDNGVGRAGNDLNPADATSFAGNVMLSVQVAKVDTVDIEMNCTVSASAITATLTSGDTNWVEVSIYAYSI